MTCRFERLVSVLMLRFWNRQSYGLMLRTWFRRVVRDKLEACASAINRNDKKASLDQLAEASTKLRRVAAGLIGKYG